MTNSILKLNGTESKLLLLLASRANSEGFISVQYDLIKDELHLASKKVLFKYLNSLKVNGFIYNPNGNKANFKLSPSLQSILNPIMS